MTEYMSDVELLAYFLNEPVPKSKSRRLKKQPATSLVLLPVPALNSYSNALSPAWPTHVWVRKL